MATTKPKGKSKKQASSNGQQGVSKAARGADGKFLPGHSLGAESRWEPGQSGNPFGRRGSMTDILRHMGEERISNLSQTRREKVAAMLWARAEKGDLDAAKYIFDRIDGRPRQALDITTTNKQQHYERAVAETMARYEAKGQIIDRKEAIEILSAELSDIREVLGA